MELNNLKLILKRIFKKYWPLFLLIFFFLTILWQFKTLNIPVIQERYLPCIKYIEEGTLYGGQPRCVQGPVTYYTFFIFEKIFGGLSNIFLILLMSIFHTITFILILKILKKEIKKYFSPVLVFILYFFLMVILIKNNLESFFAAFYLMVGFYILLYSNLRYKEGISGLFFWLSLFSNANSAIFIFIIITYYLIRLFIYKSNEGKLVLNRNKTNIKKFLSLIIPIILMTILFLFIYPNGLIYTILTQLTKVDRTLGVIIKTGFQQLIPHDSPFETSIGDVGMLPLTSELSQFVILSLILSFFAWIKNKKSIITIISFFGYVVLLFAVFRNHVDLYFRYIIPALPFLILSISILNDQINRKFLKSLFRIGVFFMLFIGIFSLLDIVYEKEFKELNEEIGYVLNFIPENSYILGDNKERLQKLDNINLNFSRFDNYPKEVDLEYDIDPTQLKKLDSFGIINEEWNNLYLEREQLPPGSNEFGQKLSNKEYDVVIGVPPALEIVFLIELVEKYYEKKGIQFDNPYQHRLDIPTLTNRVRGSKLVMTLIFKNEKGRDTFRENLTDYYNKHFDGICKKDRYIANFVIIGLINTDDLDKNKWINGWCISKNPIFFRTYSKYLIYIWEDIILILFIIVAIFLYTYFEHK